MKYVDDVLTPIKNNPKFGDDFVNFQLYVNEEKRMAAEEERNRIMEEMRKLGIPKDKINSIVFPKNESNQTNA